MPYCTALLYGFSFPLMVWVQICHDWKVTPGSSPICVIAKLTKIFLNLATEIDPNLSILSKDIDGLSRGKVN